MKRVNAGSTNGCAKVQVDHSQPAFTSSKLTVETLEQDVKYAIKTSERRYYEMDGYFKIFVLMFS